MRPAAQLFGGIGACPRAGQRPDPGDGHTLAAVLPELEAQIGVNLERILAAGGYNFWLLILWLRLLPAKILAALAQADQHSSALPAA